ncbi:hypothetical protein [Aquimarina sediminis]|uniref:hypothetical protein n=1 Tax=Aquimarina sediminis TaxID=2070536 RepID=UPI000CA016BB|nr:hypothetical protein [Aquimarina sediminis]
MNIEKSSFHPIDSLDNKSNYKKYYRIEKNGKIIERIFLDILNPSHRELIICTHYFRNQVKLFLNETIGINIISRDNPWDFKIQLSTNEIFNVEVTAISENRNMFEKFKNEERYILNSFKEKIPFYELEKLNKLFPSEDSSKQIQQLKDLKTGKKSLIDNPYYEKNPTLFVSGFDDIKRPFSELIREAIEKKENKKHLEKESTVLVIDNRTLTYEMNELDDAEETLRDFLDNTSFREIWLYTGYYSDNDANNAEFSFSPLKLTREQQGILIRSDIRSQKDRNIFYVDKTFNLNKNSAK